jgi:hypothetical protein
VPELVPVLVLVQEQVPVRLGQLALEQRVRRLVDSEE